MILGIVKRDELARTKRQCIGQRLGLRARLALRHADDLDAWVEAKCRQGFEGRCIILLADQLDLELAARPAKPRERRQHLRDDFRFAVERDQYGIDGQFLSRRQLQRAQLGGRRGHGGGETQHHASQEGQREEHMDRQPCAGGVEPEGEYETCRDGAANRALPDVPAFQDYGEILLHTPHASGFIRVDWFTPDGLPAWGDGRLFLLGTEGTIELRKYVDIAGRPGENHLFLVDKKGVQHIDCSNVDLPFGRQFLDDVRNRTETAMPQQRCYNAMKMALTAQQMAEAGTEWAQ
mgnify:CR=1 FL=1